MKNAGTNKFRWPLKNDIEEYQLHEIVSLIPEPEGVGRQAPPPPPIRNWQIDPLFWEVLKDYETS